MHIRWMIRRDMAEVLEIERQSFEFPWGEETFLAVLRRRNCIGMIAEIKDQVVGYVVYELQQKQINLLNVAVHPQHVRQGVGRAIFDRLKLKLCPERRKAINLVVRETNLTALRFFKAMGFRATGIIKSDYDEVSEDAIAMSYSLWPTPEQVWSWALETSR